VQKRYLGEETKSKWWWLRGSTIVVTRPEDMGADDVRTTQAHEWSIEQNFDLSLLDRFSKVSYSIIDTSVHENSRNMMDSD
jgi:hypothetical protein